MTSAPTPPDDSSSESGHETARREKMRKLIDLGVDPWGQRFDDRLLIGDIRAKAGEILFHKEGGSTVAPPTRESQPDLDFRKWLADQGKGELKGPKVRAAGRIILQRDAGKLRFINIQDWTGRIQLMIGQAQVGEESWKVAECCDLGDLIGVDGEFKYTKTGEPTIFAEKLHFLGKCILPPPDKHAGLADQELRHRMRYLDLLYTDGALARFLSRTKVVASIRSTLNQQGYCEIEGPTLHTIAGGAAARPFKTHHNTLDMQLFLRIALELHLKRLLVGGMERVYELGRVYRNEGISPKHNPEFTMLEVYQAFGNYETMMDLTEAIICNSIKVLDGNYVRPWGEKQIDFTPPFQRRTYDDLFREHAGVDPQDPAAVKALAEKIGFETANKHPDVIKSEVFEEKVEDALIGPIFVTDYPSSICPLTKRKTSNPLVAERFELFVHGMEVANAYTELNDPDLQEQLFSQQLAGQAADDTMAKMDTDFVRALKFAMPPAGGLGIGIDRLVMLLTNTQSIRDVILFPVLRPE